MLYNGQKLVGVGRQVTQTFFAQKESTADFIGDWMSPVFVVSATPPTPLGQSLNYMIKKVYL